MHRFITLMLVLAVGLCGVIPAGAQAPAAQKLVRAIEVSGLKHVTPEVQEQVKKLLKTQKDQPLDEAVVKKDVVAMLDQGWFYRAWSSIIPQGDGVRVVFNVEENPVITAISLAGNTIFTKDILLASLKSRVGQVLNDNYAEPDAQAIRQLYIDKGYILSQVVDKKITNGELQYSIQEPKIGEIRIESDKKSLKTRDYVIRRELQFKVGDVYNEFAVQSTRLALNRLGIFEDVNIHPEMGTEPGLLIVPVQVVERRTGQASVGVGQSNIKGIIGFFSVADTNFFGSGQTVSAQVQFGGEDSYQLSYANPWAFKNRTSLAVNLYNRTVPRQLINNNDTLLFNERVNGGNISLGRPLSKDMNTRGYITLRSDHSRNDMESGSIPANVSAQLAPSDVNSIGMSLVRDTRDNYMNPSGGRYASADVEVAGLGGAKFTKLTAEYRQYKALWQKKPAADTESKKPPVVWASRVKLGYLTGTPPYQELFLVGGADTLRGYKDDNFPGVNRVLLNTELRVPINESMQVVGFVDGGDAWGGRLPSTYSDETFRFRYGYGVGVRVVLPIGPIRLDYGFNGEGGREFHFGIGSTF